MHSHCPSERQWLKIVQRKWLDCSVKEIAGEEDLGCGFNQRIINTLNKLQTNDPWCVRERDFLQVAERMRNNSKPQYKEVRFNSTCSNLDVYNLKRAASTWIIRQQNQNSRQKHPCTCFQNLSKPPTGSMASLGRGSGKAWHSIMYRNSTPQNPMELQLVQNLVSNFHTLTPIIPFWCGTASLKKQCFFEGIVPLSFNGFEKIKTIGFQCALFANYWQTTSNAFSTTGDSTAEISRVLPVKAPCHTQRHPEISCTREIKKNSFLQPAHTFTQSLGLAWPRRAGLWITKTFAARQGRHSTSSAKTYHDETAHLLLRAGDAGGEEPNAGLKQEETRWMNCIHVHHHICFNRFHPHLWRLEQPLVSLLGVDSGNEDEQHRTLGHCRCLLASFTTPVVFQLASQTEKDFKRFRNQWSDQHGAVRVGCSRTQKH